MTLEFTIPDMACGACANTIEKAVKTIDPTATVEANTDTKVVKITTDESITSLKQAIQQAGYHPA